MSTPDIDDIEWLEPWAPVDERLREALERELRREVMAGHVLFGRRIRAIATRPGEDDVLFIVEDPGQLAVVHLTYAREARPEWPHTMMFASIPELIERCMVPDHQELANEEHP